MAALQAIGEAGLERLKEQGESDSPPWWEQVSGTFEGSSAYDRAMELGRESRQDANPETNPPA